MKRREMSADDLPFSRSVMGLLLYGWSDERHTYPKDDRLAPFLLKDADLCALWRTYHVLIEREAQRVGVKQPWIARCCSR